jgi:hypothetical protein
MQEPRTITQYLELVDEVLFEIGELIACAEEEGDAEAPLADPLPVYQQLAHGLRQLQAEVRDGSARLGGGEDLAIMPLVKQWKRRLPFAAEIDMLNLCYKRGLAG